MTIWDFLETESVTIADNVTILQFYGNNTEYPLLFFKHVLDTLACYKRVIRLNGKQLEINDLYSVLSTTFLGTSCIYWLGDIHGISVQCAQYLKEYQGPHTILFYVQQPIADSSQAYVRSIEIPHIFDNESLILFAKSIAKYPMKASQYMPILQKEKKQLTLDKLMLIRRYVPLLESTAHSFAATWLLRILNPQKSLFSLSEYFFLKDPKKFFLLWSQICHDYSYPFWTVFWSDQLWKACYYIYFMRQDNYIQAKKIGYRLPFRFLNGDWQNHSLDDLKRAHVFLYSLDYSLKHGSTGAFLDLFYLSFFIK